MRLAIGIAFVLMLCPVAHAAHWSLKDTLTAIRIADARWPVSPCHAGETITWVTSTAAVYGPQVYGLADVPDCRVWINYPLLLHDSPTPDFLCAVLEHEFGHLDGLAHSDNPHSIMYAGGGLFVPYDCAHAFPARRMCRYLPNTGQLVYARPMVADVCG